MAERLCPISRAAKTQPDAPALVAPEETWTYREYHAAVTRAAARLWEIGLRRESALAMAAHPSVEYVLALMGLFRLRAIACPINPRWPVNRILEALQGIACTRLALSHPLQLEGIKTFRLATIVGRGHGTTQEPGNDSGTCFDPVSPLLSTEQPATIIFTSGSSGEPKAALLSYGNHQASALASNRNIPLGPGDRWLLSLPLHHVAGIGVLFRCIVSGAAVVIPRIGEPIHETIRRSRVTHVSLVSTQLYRLLRDPRAVEALAGLKAILLGGSAMPEPLIRRAVELRLPIYTSYGLTEMAGQVTTTRPGDRLDKLLTSGVPIEPDTVAISCGGEILVRGSRLFLGYVGDGAVHLPRTRKGWFATGDLGEFDPDGCLRVRGRKDNLFVSGGENVQPEAVERALCRIEGITDAVVVPVEDEEFGFLPAAFVRSDTNEPLDRARLADQLAHDLPRYVIPRHFFPWPARLARPDAKVNRPALGTLAKKLLAQDKIS